MYCNSPLTPSGRTKDIKSEREKNKTHFSKRCRQPKVFGFIYTNSLVKSSGFIYINSLGLGLTSLI